jgi:peptide/nickel transport system substrate-binding protein
MKNRFIFLSTILVVIFSMVFGLTASTAQSTLTAVPSVLLKPGMTAAEVVATLPRNETLYFNGLQWDLVACWNPYSTGCNNAMALSQQDNARVTMFETPYIYNMLTGEQFPLLADGPYAWNDSMTEITFTLKTAAHWSDGTPVTADDVAYTWTADAAYQTSTWWNYKDYIEAIEAVDPLTVRVSAILGQDGKALNPLVVESYLTNNYVIQMAWTQILEERAGGDPGAFLSDPAEDVVWSGPYHKSALTNDTIVVLVRDDSYWGQDVSMWGKLPTPKYLAHVIYPDNDAGSLALRNGKVDVSQQYNPNVQDLWLIDHLPISTYLPEAPYMIGASMPTAFYNLASYGLDNPIIRKAIAIAVDYDKIIAEAITNQSATFEQVPRSLMNPSDYEQSLFDHAAVKDLQWAGYDIAGAIELLDTAGITDTNSDGWREYNGTTLRYIATCPDGWTDWQAAIEIVAAAGQAIGIDITTNYPTWADYQTIVTNWPLPQTGYDIFMMWSDGAGPTQPWSRIRHLISSEYAFSQNNWNGNWGGYANPAADAIIQAIPTETDPATLKQYYTDLTEIYLTDIPSFSLMYRPQSFHTVSELVWKNFPQQGDGVNPPVPPLNLIDGYSIAGLYNLYIPSQLYLPTISR